MKDFEKELKALANKRRLAIIKYLKRAHEASVGEMAEEISLSLRSTSRHLAVLTSASVIESDQRGLYVFYRLAAKLRPATKSIVDLL